MSIVIEKAKALVKESGSRKNAAYVLEISEAHLGEIIRGTRNAGPKVLAKLGLARQTEYKEIENERESQ